MSDKVPEDEKHFPEWMNKEFFEDILKSSEKDESIKVTDFVVKPGSNVGDHYASVMFRALITYNTQAKSSLETSLIVKTMPFVEGAKKELLEQGTTFETEIKIYSEIIPLVEKTLKDTEIACKCLYTTKTSHKTLVFEDLSRRNYESPGNFKTLKDDMFKVALKALEKLAKWHAVTFKLNSEDNKISENFKTGVFSGYFLDYVPLFKEGFPSFLKMLKSKPEFDIYAKKFEKLIENGVMRKAQKGFNAFVDNEPASLFVLNHGDAHLKNTMMSRKSDGTFDVLLIDFQTCYWGPAVMDLMYFLYMSISAEIRETKRDEIIYTYHKIFVDTLRELGFEGELPKLTDLYKDFLTYKDYELMLITTMLPLVSFGYENDGESDAAKFMEDADFRTKTFYMTGYQNLLKKILPDLLHKGYLD